MARVSQGNLAPLSIQANDLWKRVIPADWALWDGAAWDSIAATLFRVADVDMTVAPSGGAAAPVAGMVVSHNATTPFDIGTGWTGITAGKKCNYTDDFLWDGAKWIRLENTPIVTGEYEYVPRVLTSITVTPAAATIDDGATQQFTATGTYSDASTADITGDVTWASDDESSATITSGGLATGEAQGRAIISATLGAVSGSTDLGVFTFGDIPFGVTVNGDGTTNFDPTVYRLVEGASGVTTYYVDKATGVDTNPGTAIAPFKTIYKAVLASRATAPTMLIKVKGGTYYLTENFTNKIPEATNLSVIPWDDQPVICSNENPNITPASWTLDTDNTYYASVAGYGYSPNRSSVWDAKVGDGFGDYLPLVPVASIALVKTTANSYYTELATSRVYAHCSDNRAPDADIHVFEAWGTPGQYKNYAGSPANGRCYFENIHFRGGARSFALQNTHETNTFTSVFNGCTFKYGGVSVVASLQLDGNGEIALVDCLVTESHTDGFSYHSYSTFPAPRAIEINCEARCCGSILTGTANQGSTIHDGGKIVRVNGHYHHCENDQVADVSAAGKTTKSWMVRCSVHDGLKANYSGYLCGNGTGVNTMWLSDCTVEDCTYDLTIGTGSTLYDKDYATRGTVSGAGTRVDWS